MAYDELFTIQRRWPVIRASEQKDLCLMPWNGVLGVWFTSSYFLQYSKDEDPIVADSCIVALDMLKHEQSGAFEYCSIEQTA